MNLTRIDDRQQPQRPADVVIGQRHDELAQPEQLEQHVRRGSGVISLRAQLGTSGRLPLARQLARLLGDPGCLRHQPLARRPVEQRRADARDRDRQRARVESPPPRPEAHRLDQHGAAAAERIDDGFAGRR